MLKALYSWYLRTFLPFEQEDHPLYASTPVEEDLSDWDDLGPYQQREGVGPHYSEHFHRPTEYVQWGSKWYRKAK